MSVTQEEVAAAVEELRREVQLPLVRHKFASAGFGEAVASDENLERAFAIGSQIYLMEQAQHQKVASQQGELMKFAYEQFPGAAAKLGVQLPQAAQYDSADYLAQELLNEQNIKTAVTRVCTALASR